MVPLKAGQHRGSIPALALTSTLRKKEEAMRLITNTGNAVEGDRADALDDAGAELCLSNTLLLAADNFLDEIRRWVRPGGAHECAPLLDEVLHTQKMIAEAMRHMSDASELIDRANTN